MLIDYFILIAFLNISIEIVLFREVMKLETDCVYFRLLLITIAMRGVAHTFVLLKCACDAY